MDKKTKEKLISAISECNDPDDLSEILSKGILLLNKVEVEELLDRSGEDAYGDDYNRFKNTRKNDKIIDIPGKFALLSFLLNKEIENRNIIIMDKESCKAFTASIVCGIEKNNNKKCLLIANEI